VGAARKEEKLGKTSAVPTQSEEKTMLTRLRKKAYQRE